MAITLKTHKMLWGRSGNKCAFPDCNKELVLDETETDDSSIVGDEAHIVAKEPNGPRGDSILSSNDRDKYDNLILLCKVHHKLVDDQPNTYTVEKLSEMKRKHTERIQGRPDYDQLKQRDDELYSTYIEKWASMVNLDEWNNWGSYVFGGGQPSISVNQYNNLREANEYIFSRVWPKRYPAIENAFLNFSHVLNDFLTVFDKHKVKLRADDDSYRTEKFYKKDIYEHAVYDKLLEQYDYHVDLVEDLMLELTRATNYLCDQIRKYLFHTFRIEAGVLLVTSGPHSDLSFKTYRVEYRSDKSLDQPYPGLKEFTTIRTTRDNYFGDGYNEDYFFTLG